MNYKRNLIHFFLFFSNLLLLVNFFTLSQASESRELMCDGDFTEHIFKYDEDNFEYLESRNDIGIFYDFTWDNISKQIVIKRNKDNYPIVMFSLFEKEKIIPGKTSIKTLNSVDLSKLNDDELKLLSYANGKINLELVNGNKLEIVSKPYELNNFTLSNFNIVSIHNIDTAKGILEMSFDSTLTNVRNDITKLFKYESELLNEYKGYKIDICDDFKDKGTWPLMSVEFDEFKYDADVREGLKNKEKLKNPVFEIFFNSNNEIRTLRTEKGVGFFRQSFDFKKFPFDTQKLIITIKTGAGNFENVNNTKYSDTSGSVTFLNPEPDVFNSLNKFIDPKINKLKAWKIPEGGISVKNKVIYEKDYYEIISEKNIPRSENLLNIEIIIERNFQHYLFKIILPVFLILCVAWYVLWIPIAKYEVRLNTSIIALLALIAYNFVFQDDIPKLEYLTDLDWFILLSYIFCCMPVFLSIGFSKFISKNQKMVTKVNRYIRNWGVLLYIIINLQIFYK